MKLQDQQNAKNRKAAYDAIIFALKDMGVVRDHPNSQWRRLCRTIRIAVNAAAGIDAKA